MILENNIVFLYDNFDFFIRKKEKKKDDRELEEGCIFKYIVNLNYLKNIKKERYIVYLIKMLIFLRLLECNIKFIVKKRKLFKTEYVF